MKRLLLFTFLIAIPGMHLQSQNWIPVPFLQYNMQVIANLQYTNGSFSLNSGDVVGAFAGDECRGIMSPSPGLSGIIFLTIGSNAQAGENITFKAYLSAENLVVDLEQTLVFQNQWQTGSMASPFIFTYQPVIPAILTIQNTWVADGENICYQALETIVTAGSGTSFQVGTGANVNLAAGQKISLLPGTCFHSGARVRGFIDFTGNFCNSQMAGGNSAAIKSIANAGNSITPERIIRIFPNPVKRSFYIEIKGPEMNPMIRTGIYDGTGRKILGCEIQSSQPVLIDLTDYPDGLYYVTLWDGDQYICKKIVRSSR